MSREAGGWKKMQVRVQGSGAQDLLSPSRKQEKARARMNVGHSWCCRHGWSFCDHRILLEDGWLLSRNGTCVMEWDKSVCVEWLKGRLTELPCSESRDRPKGTSGNVRNSD